MLSLYVKEKEISTKMESSINKRHDCCLSSEHVREQASCTLRRSTPISESLGKATIHSLYSWYSGRRPGEKDPYLVAREPLLPAVVRGEGGRRDRRAKCEGGTRGRVCTTGPLQTAKK